MCAIMSVGDRKLSRPMLIHSSLVCFWVSDRFLWKIKFSSSIIIGVARNLILDWCVYCFMCIGFDVIVTHDPFVNSQTEITRWKWTVYTILLVKRNSKIIKNSFSTQMFKNHIWSMGGEGYTLLVRSYTAYHVPTSRYLDVVVRRRGAGQEKHTHVYSLS